MISLRYHQIAYALSGLARPSRSRLEALLSRLDEAELKHSAMLVRRALSPEYAAAAAKRARRALKRKAA